MEYKSNLELNIKLKTEHIYKKYGRNVKIIVSSSERNRANYQVKEGQCH